MTASAAPREFVLATHNAHKVLEFQELLGRLLPGIRIIGYDGPEPEEDGQTFEANAMIKALAAARHTGLPALADDSGICVEILGGAPGIFSARWAGADKSDAANRQKLLADLADVPDDLRQAYFQCTIAVVIPRVGDEDEVFTVEGRWPGVITHSERGDNGFGYDPIFLPEGQSITAAEMHPADKNTLSHRARALAALAKKLGS